MPVEARQPKAFRGIELLRFLCALAVVLSHYKMFYQGADGNLVPDLSAEDLPALSLLGGIYQHGNYAVILFWTVSGFIFAWKYARSIHEQRISAGRFLWLRFSRLYPLHFLTLLAVLILQVVYDGLLGAFYVHGHIDLRHFVLNLLFIPEWGLQSGMSYNAPFWSVSAELFAYLVFFLTARYLTLNFWTSLALVGLWSVVFWTGVIRLTLAHCTVMFFVGAGCFYLHRALDQRGGLLGLVRRAMPWIALVSSAIGLFGWSYYERALSAGGAHIVRFFIVAPALLLLFVHAGAHVTGRRLARVLDFLGDLTYASYLLHFPLLLVIVLVVDAAGYSRAHFASPVVFSAYVVLVFALSAACFHYVEAPAQRALRRLVAREPVALAPRAGGN